MSAGRGKRVAPPHGKRKRGKGWRHLTAHHKFFVKIRSSGYMRYSVPRHLSKLKMTSNH